MQGVPFNSNEQFFEQENQLVSLATRKPFNRLLEARPSVSEQFDPAFLTRDCQMKGNNTAVFASSSLDKAICLKAVDEPDGARMRHSEHAGEEIDRQTRFMTNHAKRRRSPATMSNMPLGGL